jgi:hypothetical protein
MWDKRTGEDRGLHDIEADERYRRLFLTRIRELGYNTIRPPGVPKTMQQLIDEADASDEEGGDASGGFFEGGLQEELGGVEENGLGDRPGLEDVDEGDLDTQPTNLAPGASGLVEFAQGGGLPGDQDDDEEIDLDAGIPDAEDEGYDDYGYDDDNDRYDDNDYEEGFIASDEEYEPSDQPLAGDASFHTPARPQRTLTAPLAHRRSSSAGSHSRSSSADNEDMSLV